MMMALAIGVCIVVFQTKHMQAANKLTKISKTIVDLQQEIWLQETKIVEKLGQPGVVKDKVKDYDLEVLAPGKKANLDEEVIE